MGRFYLHHVLCTAGFSTAHGFPDTAAATAAGAIAGTWASPVDTCRSNGPYQPISPSETNFLQELKHQKCRFNPKYIVGNGNSLP